MSGSAKKVACVGGGLGVAPMFPQARAYQQAGAYVIGIVGFRSADLVFWQERLAAWSDTLVVCTDDGSAGRPGLVTSALAELLECERPDLVVAIGPMPMMRACAETTRPYGVKTLVSLNTIMGDGTGMCGTCRVSVGGEVKFACVDGPDFDAHDGHRVQLSPPGRVGARTAPAARAGWRLTKRACTRSPAASSSRTALSSGKSTRPTSRKRPSPVIS
jgi:NAD(P)H-flavin reductase